MKTQKRRSRPTKIKKAITRESLQCRGFKCKLSKSLRKLYHKPRKGNRMSRKGGWPWSKRKTDGIGETDEIGETDGTGEQFREQISEEEKKSWIEELPFVNKIIEDLEQRRLNHLHDKAPNSILKKTDNPNNQNVRFRDEKNLKNIIYFNTGDIIPEFVRSDGKRYGGEPNFN